MKTRKFEKLMKIISVITMILMILSVIAGWVYNKKIENVSKNEIEQNSSQNADQEDVFKI